jgi:hypothetical protein
LWVEFQGKRYYLTPDGYFFSSRTKEEKPESLHRAIMEAYSGPIPEGWQVHHGRHRLDNSPASMERLSVSEHKRAHQGESNRGPWQKRCLWCGKDFSTLSPNGQYCTATHRNLARRKRQRGDSPDLESLSRTLLGRLVPQDGREGTPPALTDSVS